MKIGYNLAAIMPCNYSKQTTKNNRKAGREDEIQTLVDFIKDKTGVVPKHLLPLQCLASELNCIIGVRPIDKLATELIASGYPTKGFHIKGKSACWGPQAGFICEQQYFSKLENASVACRDKFNQQIQECIREGHAAAVDLIITRTRLGSLLERGVIDDLTLENAKGVRRFKAKAPSGKIYSFEARRLTGLGEDNYPIFHDDKQIKVLAPTQHALPFTADYDLLIIAPHISDLGAQDNLPVPDISHTVLHRRVATYHKPLPADHVLMQDYSDPVSFYHKENPDTGNASQRIRQLIVLINSALVGDGEKIVHHNVDATSPATDPLANYPATFALPEKMGRFDRLCVIENEDDFRELIAVAKNSGYYIKVNPLWGEAISKIRSQSFDNARTQLMHKFSS